MSKGNIDRDFESEWQDLVVKTYHPSGAPQMYPEQESEGWKMKTGSAGFMFNKSNAVAMLITASGFERCVSIVVITNSQDYTKNIEAVLSSVGLVNPLTTKKSPAKETVAPPGAPAKSSGFAFTTTNFDDGWVATEQADWVRATKGNTVVLIHYAQPDIRKFNNLDESTTFVWNTLVAPRYSNMTNSWMRKSWWADGGFMDAKYFGEADLVENGTGKKVHVVLFRNGNGGKWIEIITADKAGFQNQFTVVYAQDGTDWNKLSVLANLNKFAVAASDLPGQWGGWSGAGVEYINVYTGAGAGMGHASSSNDFTFNNNGTYKSEYKGVSGSPGGATQYHGEKYSGQYVVTNWEMKLTNRFKGATETFAIQFEAVKGGRVLHMYRGSIEELHLFKVK